ncbi:pyrroloquinoline quinone biosynthesis protein PqqB [Winogradskya consettensis]|uniref:Coenzyme PQQ synthesis protein B n=1 Tax=Winogradskya consettensis TaxID=113560 RepID=A0A919T1X2_9ACTN|nr:MBL fold metallo-hydrolase [Actinoplanes consettensis]GIM84225.1 coenzyme PQQ synthesis protein B [Actinoplanes consettensis]
MRVLFLGTAAGGGLPQWNCGCPSCVRARHEDHTRTQDGLAVTGDGSAWWLLNTSPDIRTQLLRTPALTPPPGTRRTPVRGVLFTSAELDHTLGFAALREAESLTVHATAPVLDVTPSIALAGAYTTVSTQVVVPGKPFDLDGGLTVTAVSLGTKKPRYAATAPDSTDWVVGYRITGPGGTLLYAPCLPSWSEAFTEAGLGADVVILDGTFYREDEMVGRSARAMGHLPMVDSLPLLDGGATYIYTHLNNTNPAAWEGTPEHTTVTAAGALIAPEAGELSARLLG